jgi:methionine--tRNA ligase beta chain
MTITFKEFERFDIRVGKVIQSERIEGTKKLFRLKVDLGSSQNQIVAGGGETYDPEYFMNKNFIVLTNLEPKVIAGTESKGMILAADVDGKPIWLNVPSEVPAGTKVL